MIETMCVCGADFKAAESQINFAQRCRNCGQLLTPVCAEPLSEGGGAADFDALLTVASGPKHVGEVFFLGGVPNIEFGKLPGKHILLESSQVSRNHGYFQRVDFGPSSWQLEDNKSTNGIFVNGHRITSHPLLDGDRITIGDYELIYRSMFNALFNAAPAPVAATAAGTAARGVSVPQTGGPLCPSCERSLAPAAKICTACGINLASGRPLLTTGGLDEDEVEAKAQAVLQWVSWIVPFTIFPIPIASEALSPRKPWAIWVIAGLTIFVSLIFFFAQQTSNGESGRNLMLWPMGTQSVESMKDADIEKMVKSMGRAAYREFVATKSDLKGEVPDDQLTKKAFEEVFGADFGEFHWYQLFTHAFLHDPSNILNFAMHLGGNMVFLLVFGTRVNSLIGNVATIILYPLLGVVSGLTQMALGSHGIPVPSLGASGAINGLAGMYLILFPIHRVYCAWWWRWGLYGGFRLSLKVFAARGFWILLMYFAYDLLIGLLTRNSSGGGTAHWAHIGGFVTGASVAVILLLSRQFNTRGGDMISVLLGKHAWPLLGKPSKWIAQPPPVPSVRAVSMTYQG
jgi:membrane associated rhomboid family serine protease/pSer/pThr/pTyr-binding forkhead associated (FHA) protein